MSAKGRKSDWIILIVAVASSAAVMWWLSGSQDMGGSPEFQPPVRTTVSANRQGALGLFLLLEQLDFNPRRSFGQLHRARLRGASVLVLVNPVVDLTPVESEHLRSWVRGGGLLVCTTDVRQTIDRSAAIPSPIRFRPQTQEPPQAIEPKTYSGPLARDVTRLDLETTTLWGLGRTEPEEESGPERPSPDKAKQDDDVLLRGPDGRLIVEQRLDRGRIIVLVDSSFLSNDKLDEGDHSVLAVNLFAYCRAAAGSDRLLFDEYHHGMGGEGETGWTVLSDLLVSTPAGWGVLCLTAAAGCCLLLLGRRFGPRRGPPGRRRRSKFEFVESIGAACRKAGANALVFNVIFRRLRRRLAQRAGLPVSAPTDDIAERLGGDQAARERYRKLLNAAQAVETDKRLSHAHMERLLTAAGRIEKEIFNGNT